MLKAQDWGPGLDQNLFGIAGVQTAAVVDGTPSRHLEKTDLMFICMFTCTRCIVSALLLEKRI